MNYSSTGTPLVCEDYLQSWSKLQNLRSEGSFRMNIYSGLNGGERICRPTCKSWGTAGWCM